MAIKTANPPVLLNCLLLNFGFYRLTGFGIKIDFNPFAFFVFTVNFIAITVGFLEITDLIAFGLQLFLEFRRRNLFRIRVVWALGFRESRQSNGGGD